MNEDKKISPRFKNEITRNGSEEINNDNIDDHDSIIKSPSIQNELQEVITLLKENNEYFKQFLNLKKKEHRQAVIKGVFHFILNIIPWIALLVLGYFIWQSIMHYLDALNNNVNTLKGNFDALFEFFKKLVPNFSSIESKIQTTWENAQFWK